MNLLYGPRPFSTSRLYKCGRFRFNKAMRTTTAWLASLLLLLTACGNSPKTLGPAKTPTNNPNTNPGTCPATPPSSFHRLTLHFAKPLPAKIGLRLDIDKDVRVSECATLKQSPPFAAITRVNGTNDLVVEIDHAGFYNPLPRDVTFDVLDLESCGTSLQVFYSLKAEPLFWKLDYPNGPTCAGRAVAIQELIPGLE
jgi:hypothetical protein